MPQHREDPEAAQLAAATEPLAERVPIYARLFGIGLAAAAALGLAGWVFFGLSARLGREIGALLAQTWFGGPAPGVVWGPVGGYLTAVGYALLLMGTGLLLVGGTRGGGYSNIGIGSLEALVGGRNRTHDDFEADADLRHGRVMQRRDPMERLRKGLRPQANPSAFWQSIAGFAYIGLGVVMLSI